MEIAADLEISAEVAQGAHLAPRAFRHVRLRAGDTLIKLMEIEAPPAAGSTDFKAGAPGPDGLLVELVQIDPNDS